MPKYVIEREIPEAGKLSPQQLQSISQKSCGVLKQLGPQIQWIQSYVTDDKIYCVYIAPNEEMVREHAQQGGFPQTAFLRSNRSLIQRRQRRNDLSSRASAFSSATWERGDECGGPVNRPYLILSSSTEEVR